MATPDQPSYRQRIGYHSGLLGLFALLASTGLMMSHIATKDEIATRMQEDLRISLGKVIPDRVHDNDISADVVHLPASSLSGNDTDTDIYLARKSNHLSAVAFQVTAPDGYAGPVAIMMGIDINGEILGVRVVSHAETPGLGDKIEVSKSKWILGFDGLSLSNTSETEWHVKKDGGRFDQFSGATITPRAVVKAVKNGLSFFKQHKQQILQQSSLTGDKQQ